uniref:Uncharacterized protein n=1 Tax=Anopheles funestus TaxID=62324 RepID=A0A4Y0BNP4_ANOFN
MIDTGTGETLLQVSIYQISYCSADANHDHVFAFVGCTLGSEAEVKEMCFRRTGEEINLEGPLLPCFLPEAKNGTNRHAYGGAQLRTSVPDLAKQAVSCGTQAQGSGSTHGARVER